MFDISVIIPAYNAAKTIDKTISSVRTALLRLSGSSEIVVVDDGSTDQTSGILDHLADEIRRTGGTAGEQISLRVFQQENQGAYSARNLGVVKSSGKWIAFVDADDRVEPDVYVKLISFAEENDLQVAECDIFGYEKKGRGKDFWMGRDEVRNQLSIPWLIEGNEASFMWDKIYRRNVWPEQMHPSRIFMYDDLMTNLQVFRGIERFGVLHEPLYHYQVNEGSSVRRFGRRNIRDFMEIVKFRKIACEWYGIRPNDSRMKRWFRRNLVNNIKLAIRATLKV